MPISHRRRGQDKTVLSCPRLRCELSITKLYCTYYTIGLQFVMSICMMEVIISLLQQTVETMLLIFLVIVWFISNV